MSKLLTLFGTLVLLLLLHAVRAQEASIRSTDLPFRRIRTPATGWVFCDYSCADTDVVIPKEIRDGVLTFTISHKPIPNVTPEMMLWAYQNMHKSVLTSVNATARASLYQLMHPVDHASMKGPVAPGQEATWIEIPVTGCKLKQNLPKDMWSCTNRTTGKDDRSGFVRRDSASEYQKLFHSKIKVKVTELSKSGYRAYAENSPITGTTLLVSYIGHTWQQLGTTLKMTSTVKIGRLQAVTPNGTPQFSTEGLLGGLVSIETINGEIRKAFLNGESPALTVTQAAYAMILHTIQEWQRLPLWLPKVYEANK